VISAIKDRPLDDPEVGRVLLDIQTGIREEHKGGPFRIKELFTWGKVQNFRRLLITISVELGQQFTGSNMINVSVIVASILERKLIVRSTTRQLSSKIAWV
jgi:hypothetical protein